jgi:hypothetical protein
VRRIFKIVALAIALGAFIGLAIFGFAIWVFIPLLPAAIIFGIVVFSLKRRSAKPKDEVDAHFPKAA